MDGANMNAQVGLCRPGDIGADVCHLNLHKTFCIPHGGGGPGMGPIGVADAPRAVPARATRWSRPAASTAIGAGLGGAVGQREHPAHLVGVHPDDGRRGAHARRRRSRSSTPTTSRKRLDAALPGRSTRASSGRVAHECILDLRPLKKPAGVEVEDVAKRLMDYGFHAPTMSFPVAGTLMIEPTESESQGRARPLLRRDDRDPRGDRARSRSGTAPREDNVLKNAPHTAAALLGRRVDRTPTRASRPPSRCRGLRERQVLAAGRARQQRARRPQARLHLPADRGLRLGLASPRRWAGDATRR